MGIFSMTYLMANDKAMKKERMSNWLFAMSIILFIVSLGFALSSLTVSFK